MLKNKTILITGSSRGIGAATARLAKKYGAKVILHGKAESKNLTDLAKELKATYIVCDIADNNEVKRIIGPIKNIDVLINNAGINPSKTFLQLTARDWADVFATNVFGTVNVTQAVLPGMIKKKAGKIINIASIKGLTHVAAKPAYAASKAAIIRLTTSLAQEFAPRGILVNAVTPGFTQTEMTQTTMSPEIKSQINKIPLKKMATPEQIAETILFLASDKSNHTTGQILTVDGGYSITN